MPRILTVDDSRAVRTIICKELLAQNFEVDEAEDGRQALDKLAEREVDLILLDVTMPEMDGPTMLAKLRASGRQTPVIMLTSEAKRSIVADAIRLGIKDYILKPFKPEELLKKVRAALRLDPSAAAAPQTATASAPPTAAAAAGKPSVDLLVVDDMENVGKRLRQLIPGQLTLESQTSAPAALLACRERVFRTILIDGQMPDVDSAVLAGQLKLLQPQAALVCLALRTNNDLGAELRAAGFSGVLYKPFTPEAVEDLVQRYCETQELIARDENLVKVAAFSGSEDRLDRYYFRLRARLLAVFAELASACHEAAILELSDLPPRPDRTPKFLLDLTAAAKAVGLSLRLVGPVPLQVLLLGFEETRQLPMFPSVDRAKAAA